MTDSEREEGMGYIVCFFLREGGGGDYIDGVEEGMRKTNDHGRKR